MATARAMKKRRKAQCSATKTAQFRSVIQTMLTEIQRDGLMYHEIADVRTQFRMAHQPLVKRLRPLQEKGGRKEEERSCGKHRKKDSQYSQPQGQQSQCSQYIFHSNFVNSGMRRYEEFQINQYGPSSSRRQPVLNYNPIINN